eukprot:148223-Rhodomonas_salina.1
MAHSAWRTPPRHPVAVSTAFQPLGAGTLHTLHQTLSQHRTPVEGLASAVAAHATRHRVGFRVWF